MVNAQDLDPRELDFAPDHDLALADVPRDEWAGMDDRTALARYLREIEIGGEAW